MSNSNIWTNFIHNYIVENDLLNFYDRFLDFFEIEWNQLISDYNFEELCQLNNGNRLRPMLVFWGYLLNRSNESLFDISDKNLEYIVDFCVIVESIHKMSLLVDDWIDNDIARHGSPTFHTIYGADTAVLLAMNLLLKGYLELSTKLNKTNELMYKKTISLALQIAYDMTLGALNEISCKDTVVEIPKVKEIIDLETSSIIRNGIVIGYTAGGGIDTNISNLLDDVGYCCGYIFQALNDMEPFGNANELVKHKGTLTTDVIQNRKNIIVAYIYAWASDNELEELIYLNNPTQISNYIAFLLKKYNINNHIMQEIVNLQLRIEDRIVKIELITGHCEWCKHFKNFIEITISASKKRALGY